jgi:hypothetical protein
MLFGHCGVCETKFLLRLRGVLMGWFRLCVHRWQGTDYSAKLRVPMTINCAPAVPASIVIKQDAAIRTCVCLNIEVPPFAALLDL